MEGLKMEMAFKIKIGIDIERAELKISQCYTCHVS